jgi:hypothetical protein
MSAKTYSGNLSGGENPNLLFKNSKSGHADYGKVAVKALAGEGTLTFSADSSYSGGTPLIKGVGTCVDATDVANKAYVDSVASGLKVKDSVRAATTANGSLSTAFAAGQSVDGVTLATDDRLLIKDQTSKAENGIYIVTAGAPSRAADFADGSFQAGAFTFIEQGTTHADTGFVCTADSTAGGDEVGTEPLNFGQFSGAAELTGGFGIAIDSGQVSLKKAIQGDSISVSGNADCGGNFAVATNQFTVAHATGNAVVAGSLQCAGNLIVKDATKFKVTDDGAVTVGGSLSVGGAATFNGGAAVATGSLTAGSAFTVDSSDGAVTSGALTCSSITTSGANPFSVSGGVVTAKNDIIVKNGSTQMFKVEALNGKMTLTGATTTTADLEVKKDDATQFKVNQTTGAVTIAGAVSVGGDITSGSIVLGAGKAIAAATGAVGINSSILLGSTTSITTTGGTTSFVDDDISTSGDVIAGGIVAGSILNGGSGVSFGAEELECGAIASSSTASFTSTVSANAFIADSDRTLKQNIAPMEAGLALETVCKMGPAQYQFKKDPTDQRCGVIAQELREVAPELVKTTDNGTLAVDYCDMMAYLIGAIQALNRQTQEQAAIINELR